MYDNSLKIAIIEHKSYYVALYFIFLILEIYSWEISGKNPGIVAY